MTSLVQEAQESYKYGEDNNNDIDTRIDSYINAANLFYQAAEQVNDITTRASLLFLSSSSVNKARNIASLNQSIVNESGQINKSSSILTKQTSPKSSPRLLQESNKPSLIISNGRLSMSSSVSRIKGVNKIAKAITPSTSTSCDVVSDLLLLGSIYVSMYLFYVSMYLFIYVSIYLCIILILLLEQKLINIGLISGSNESNARDTGGRINSLSTVLGIYLSNIYLSNIYLISIYLISIYLIYI
jgi:hypothetical protein